MNFNYLKMTTINMNNTMPRKININKLSKKFSAIDLKAASTLLKNLPNTKKRKFVRGAKLQYKHKIKRRKNYNHAKRADQFFVQGITDYISSKMGLPDQVRRDASDILKPISDLNEKISHDDITKLLNATTKISDDGISHNHTLAIDDNMLFLLTVVMLLAATISPDKWIRRVSMFMTAIIIFGKTFGNSDFVSIFKYISSLFDNWRSKNDAPTDDAPSSYSEGEYCTAESDGASTPTTIIGTQFFPAHVAQPDPPIVLPETVDNDESQPNKGFTTQAIDLNLMLRALALLFGSYSIYKNMGGISITSVSKLDTVFRKLPLLTLCIKSAEDILSTLLSLIETIGTWIGRIFSDEFKLELRGETWYEYEIIRRKLDALTLSYERREDLGGIARKAKVLQAELKALGTPKEQFAYVKYRDLSNAVAFLCDDLARFGAVGNETRKEPITIIIGGKPGIGKSYAKDIVLSYMAYHIKGPDFRQYVDMPGSDEFSPNQVEKFVSGYNNQKFVIIDDLGYSAESIETMVPRFIQMVNSMPYNMEQAEVHKKGAVYFDSEMILCTTNIDTWGHFVPKLNAPEALFRRLHLTLWCEIKKEYALANGCLDPEKIEDFSKLHWLKWYKTDPKTGVKTSLCSCGYTCKKNGDCKEARIHDILHMCIEEYDYRSKIHDDIKRGRRKQYQKMLDMVGTNTHEVIDFLHVDWKTQSPCSPWCMSCNRLRDDEIVLEFNKHFSKIDFKKGINGIPYGDEAQFEKYSAEVYDEWVKHGTKSVHFQTFSKLGHCYYDSNSTEDPLAICRYMVAYMGYQTARNKKRTTWVYDEVKRTYNYIEKKAIVTVVDGIKWTWERVKSLSKTYIFDVLKPIWNDIRFKATLVIFGLIILVPLLGRASNSIGDVLLSSVSSTKSERKHKKVRMTTETQGEDLNGEALMKSVTHSNLLHVYINGEYNFTCLGVGGSIIVMNQHIYDKLQLKEFTRITLKRWGKTGAQWQS
jgi:hypothetical protein